MENETELATLPFDTHKAVKELQEAGFDEGQAEAVVATVGAAFVGNVATKQDLMELRSELRTEMQTQIGELRSEMQTQGNEIRSEMQTQGNEVRSEMQTQGTNLLSKIQAMELRITLRMGALIVGGVALIVAPDKLL